MTKVGFKKGGDRAGNHQAQPIAAVSKNANSSQKASINQRKFFFRSKVRGSHTEFSMELLVLTYLLTHMYLQNVYIYKSALYNANKNAVFLSALFLSRRFAQSAFVRFAPVWLQRSSWILSGLLAVLGGQQASKLLFGLPRAKLIYLVLPFLGCYLHFCRTSDPNDLDASTSTSLPGGGSARVAGGGSTPPPSPKGGKKSLQKAAVAAHATHSTSAVPSSADATQGPDASTSVPSSSFLPHMSLSYFLLEVGLDTYFVALVPLKVVQHDFFYYNTFHCCLLGIYVMLNVSTLLILTEWLQNPRAFNPFSASSQLLSGGLPSPRGSGDLVASEQKRLQAGLRSHITEPHSSRWTSRLKVNVNWLLGLQFTIVVSQLVLLLLTRHWYPYTCMLVFNYLILYLCIIARRLACIRAKDESE